MKLLQPLIVVLTMLMLTNVSLAEEMVDSERRLETVLLKVDNMTCPACPITVRKALEAVSGVEEVTINYDERTATVIYDTTLTDIESLIAATTNAGYPAEHIAVDEKTQE